MVSTSAAPYGYTLTVWSSGALLIHFRGAPAVWEVFLFLVGAIVAFAALWLVGRDPIERAHPVSEQSARAFAGVLDLFAVGAAVGVATLLAMIPDWVAWPVTSIGATAVYMAAASVQLAVAEQRDGDSDEHARGAAHGQRSGADRDSPAETTTNPTPRRRKSRSRRCRG